MPCAHRRGRTIPGASMGLLGHNPRMRTTVMIRDETPTGRTEHEWQLTVDHTITLRELIRLRVREEVARYNASPTGRFDGLVRPTSADAAGDACVLPADHRIDWVQQAEVALEAFEHNAFFVVVGSSQVDDLDAELDLSDHAGVSFVRLVPLAGG
jgi:hypothetical protein